MNDIEPIPLVDGDLTERAIIPYGDVDPGVQTALRCRRRHNRKNCARSMLCFGHSPSGGRVDQAACPILNISQNGVAFEYDEQIENNSNGIVAYRTVEGRPVHVNCVVRQCRLNRAGRYVVGVRFDRKLQVGEDRPAHFSVGREIAPGMRPRKLRDEKPST